LKTKTLDYAASSMFGPGHSQNAAADILRNLSIPEQSPFGYGASNILRMNDPNLKTKMAKLIGEDATKPGKKVNAVVQSGVMSQIDKIAHEAQEDRKKRLRKQV
jgi:hypothetical protein